MIRAELVAQAERVVLEAVAKTTGDFGAAVRSLRWDISDGPILLAGLPVEGLVFFPDSLHDSQHVVVQASAGDLARWALEQRERDLG